MSRFETGWVKLHRDDLFGAVGQRGNEAFGLWSKLLCMATRYESEILSRGELVKAPAGTVVCSLQELAGSVESGAVSKVRRDLDYFESIGKIEQRTNSKGRMIQIKNWDSIQVQLFEKEPENPAKFRQTNDTQAATNRQSDDNPAPALSSQNVIQFRNEKKDTTDKRQAFDNEATDKRTLNGEEEKNKKKEESHLSSSEDRSLENLENLEDPSLEKKARSNKSTPIEEALTPKDCATPPSHIGPSDLLRVWNENRGLLPEAKALTPSRKRQAAARLRENGELAYWTQVVRSIAGSSFCNGENQREWRAGIDFLLRPDTHVKVTEGLYSKGQSKSLKPKSIEEIA